MELKERNFTEVSNLIVSKLKMGDRADIAEKVGVTTRTVNNAFKRKDWGDLTKYENEVIRAAMEVISKREDVKNLASIL